MTKPSKTPRWATNDVTDVTSGQSNVVEPQESEKDSGWTYQQKPPRQYFNWLSRITNEWIAWFNARFFDGATENDFIVSPPSATGGDLTLRGATSGATSNQNGGDVVLAGGSSTGSGSSTVTISAATAGASGTTTRSAEAYIAANGSIGAITAEKPFALTSSSASLKINGVATSSSSTGATVSVNSARGTIASPTAVQSGDEIARIAFGGASASGTWSEEKAYISSVASENWSGSAMGNRVEIATTSPGQTSPATRITVDSDGANIGSRFIKTSENEYRIPYPLSFGQRFGSVSDENTEPFNIGLLTTSPIYYQDDELVLSYLARRVLFSTTSTFLGNNPPSTGYSSIIIPISFKDFSAKASDSVQRTFTGQSFSISKIEFFLDNISGTPVFLVGLRVKRAPFGDETTYFQRYQSGATTGRKTIEISGGFASGITNESIIEIFIVLQGATSSGTSTVRLRNPVYLFVKQNYAF